MTRHPNGRRWSSTVSVVVVGGVLAVAPAAGAAEAPDSPDDRPAVTSQQRSAAVKRWDPDGSVEVRDPSGSVTVRDPRGSVRTVEEETTEGDETVVTLDSDILFEFAAAELTDTARTRVAELVADVPDAARVQVTGHTDSVGDEASNLDLSQRRAQAVADAVAAARPDLVLEVAGRGEAEPAAPNEQGGEDNPEGREQNRRVELRYTG